MGIEITYVMTLHCLHLLVSWSKNALCIATWGIFFTIFNYMSKIYAGIGSRETPPHICDMMTLIASRLESMGFLLRSGDMVVAYSEEKCIEILANVENADSDMLDEDYDIYASAIDYFSYNVAGSYVGAYTPVFITGSHD